MRSANKSQSPSTLNIMVSANMNAKERRQARQRRHRQAANDRLGLPTGASSFSLENFSEPSPLRREALENRLRKLRSQGYMEMDYDEMDCDEMDCDEIDNEELEFEKMDIEKICWADQKPQLDRLPPIDKPQAHCLPPLKTIIPASSTFEELSSPSRDPSVLTSFWSSLPFSSSTSPASPSSPLKASPTTSFTYPSVSSPTSPIRDPTEAFANLQVTASQQPTDPCRPSLKKQSTFQPNDVRWGHEPPRSSSWDPRKTFIEAIKEEDEDQDMDMDAVPHREQAWPPKTPLLPSDAWSDPRKTFRESPRTPLLPSNAWSDPRKTFIEPIRDENEDEDLEMGEVPSWEQTWPGRGRR
ncbi:hypothetical protein MMC07_000852 [Pseudocyphellaria aurata]|nr:hypothetical protein [Pseudocyphellaria aurata]